MTANKLTAADRGTVDGAQLTDEIGIDAAEIDWRKSFTRLEDRDVQRLDRMEGLLDEIADGLVDEFYDHLQQFEESMSVIGRSSKGVEALKQSQTSYLRSIGRGTYDQQYFDKRARIGKIHDMLDMGPKFYMGAYSIYYEGIMEAIAEDVKSDLAGLQPDGGASAEAATGDTPTASAAIDEVVERSMSVLKLLLVDQGVAMDTYIHSYNQQLEDELDRRKSVVEECTTSVEETKRAAEELAESSQEISHIADQQADSMGNVAGEVSNMSATIEEIASTAEEVDTTSARAEDLARPGREDATEAIGVMQEVTESTETVAAANEEQTANVTQIHESIKRLSE